MGLINEALDSKNATIGSIDIMKKFSFFEIDAAYMEKLIASLNKQSFEGEKVLVEFSKETPNRTSSNKGKFISEKKKKRHKRSQKPRGRKKRK